MSRHPFVQAAVSRKQIRVPTGGSWWTNHARENFTACAAKRFNWRMRAPIPYIEDARPPRARGPHRPLVDESFDEISADPDFAVESAESEQE